MAEDEIKAAAALAKVIKKQRMVRGGFSGHLTRVLQEIGDIPDSPDYETLTGLLERLAASSTKVKAESDKLLDLLEEERDVESEVNFQAEVTDNVLLAQVKLNSLISVHERKNKQDKEELNTTAGSQCSDKSHNNSYAGLPKLKLPMFSGDALEWRPFFDAFKASVDARDIPAVQKFTYLISSLDKAPRDALKGITCTATNYPEAIAILKSRYGDPALLIGLYAEKISSLPSVDDGETKAFRHMVDTFEASLRELTQLINEVLYPDRDPSDKIPGEGDGNNGPKFPIHHLFLAPVLTRRLPPSVHQEWLRRTPETLDRFDLTALLKFVKREIEAQEILLTRIKSDQKFHSERSHGKKHQDSPRPKAASSALVVSSSNPSKKPSCSYCGKTDHAIYKCSDFKKLEPPQRREKCDKKQLCSNCLGTKHLASNCTSDYSCFKCSERHHTLLHTDGPTPVKMSKVSDKACRRRTILQTALIHVQGINRPVRALLDTGAEISYMSETLAETCKPELEDRGFHQYEGFGGHLSKPEERSAYRVVFRSRHNLTWLSARLVAIPTLCGPQEGVNRSVTNSLVHQATKFKLADVFTGKAMPIDIVFGLDVIPQLLLEQTPIKMDRLLLTPTRLGYVVGGSIAASGNSTSSFTAVARVLRVTQSSSLSKISGEIPNDPITRLWRLDTLGISPEEISPESRIVPVRKEDRYEIPLPWIGEERPELTKNQAIRRLHSSFLKLSPEAKEEYVTILEEYHTLGILEPADGSSGNFLPHHSVCSKSKRRIVYDASAKPWKGLSLNELLHSGPNLLADLASILIRFRSYPVPLCADVEKAFLMVGVDPADREYLKIVWIDRQNSIRISRFTRVPFGITAGPYLLLKTLQHHFLHLKGRSADQDEILELIESSLYMDDLISGGESKEDVLILKEKSKIIFQDAGMNIHRFVSSPTVMEAWDRELPPEHHKVLGIEWNPSEDVLKLHLNLSHSRTKREALSSVASVFDPLGLISPWHIKAKMFLQTLWAEEGGWDDPLSQESVDQWNVLVSEVLDQNFTLELPRHIQVSELHVFVDASRNAYAAVVYGKFGEQINLICAKARVAPLRPHTLTIPRLELMGNLAGARLAEFVRKSLNLPSTCVKFYTDSMICLGWITGTPTEVFVRNRVKEIRMLFDPSQWSHVSGEENPADLPSRGIPARELVSSSFWRHGPEFLNRTTSTHLIASVAEVTDDTFQFPFERFNSLSTLRKIMGWMLRFLSNCRSPSNKTSGKLSADELQKAQQKLVLVTQMSEGRKEYQAVMGGADPPPRSPIWNARPSIDPQTNLIVCLPRHGGPPQTWLPIPSKLARLITLDVHQNLYHLGTGSTVAEINRMYYTSKLRSFVNRTLGGCTSCRRFQSRAISSPEGFLPKFRTEPSRPFQNTGLDHFGPIYIKDGTKVWGLLFTCAVTRAIHLEAVTSLNSIETSLAIRRFFARRGHAKLFISDNGPTFVQLSTQFNIIWKFNPPSAPWWGGFWERIVGTIKRSIKKTLLNSSLTFSELRTVFAELEDRVNRRPLVQNEDQPLTPAHFLLGLSPPSLSDVSNSIPENEDFSKRLQHRLQISTHLWKRWTTEYLTSLRQWRRAKTPNPLIREGDLVLVKPPENNKIPRGRWPLAKVETLHKSEADQQPRSATLRLRGKLTSRPLACLFPLEAAETRSNAQDTPAPETSSKQVAESVQEITPSTPSTTQQPEQGIRTRYGRNIRRPQRYTSSTSKADH